MGYIKITQKELDKLLDEHEKKLRQRADTGKPISVVDFKYYDLSGLSLAWRNLSYVTFGEAVLINTNFEHSVLNRTSFEKSYIEGSNFGEASLCNVCFDEAEIHISNFKYIIGDIISFQSTEITGCGFISAKLAHVTLNAEITACDFTHAEFTDVTLWGAHIRDSDFFGTKIYNSTFKNCEIERSRFLCADIYKSTIDNIKFDRPFEDIGFHVPLACPSEGAFIGFKKAKYFPENPIYKFADSYCIIKLLIPEQEKRSSATGRKCRCSGAIVLDIRKINGEELSAKELLTVHSMYFENFKYTIGQYVKPLEDFDPDRWNECSTGIHFFITREEAEDYNG